MPKKTTPKKSKKTNEAVAEPRESQLEATLPIEDPIGDETDGEAKTALETEAVPETEAEIETAEDKAQAHSEIEDGDDDDADLEDSAESEDEETTESDDDENDPEFKPKLRPPAKLERLQKILAQAGVASRRKAEEMIEQGRVQVNGKVVTELGTKADAGRDHIRVDGKLLQGAERLRYFVLNKPRGFVTTVKDPEGRPTVMQFFDKMRERLYPVGRLDYMSEGLLLVTNDGELANRLTRAAAGVEKTYLVKVAGIPTESELDILRAGVAIERGKPGSARVRTSPARIRQVRQGDNPWYEVVLIEGRNRELRKMFEEVGHFVEKIRRVGYGPLILDQEPGNLRELDAQELILLRKAADGTLRTPKSKDVRRRNAADAGQLPTIVPRSPGTRTPGRSAPKSFEDRPAPGPKDYRPKRSFEPGSGTGKPTRPSRPPAKDFGAPRPAWKKDDRPSRPPSRFAAGSTGESRPPAPKPFGDRPATGRTFGARPAAGSTYRDKPPTGRPYVGKPAEGRTFGSKPPAGRTFGDKPAAGRTFGGKPSFNKPASGKPAPGKPAWSKPAGSDRPPFKRPAAPRSAPPIHDEDLGPVRPPNLHIEEITGPDRSSPSRPSAPRSSGSRPSGPRSDTRSDAPYTRPASGRSGSGPGRSNTGRPFRPEGGLERRFTTSSGKPRPGGARPSSKPGSSSGWKPGAPTDRSSSVGWKSGKPAGRTFSESAKPSFRRDEAHDSPGPRPARPYTPRNEGASESRPERKTGPGWKPKPSFGGPGKSSSGSSYSKPKPGGFSKSGYKGKPSSGSGPKRSGKPGGKKRG